jgi:hypothetical protein
MQEGIYKSIQILNPRRIASSPHQAKSTPNTYNPCIKIIIKKEKETKDQFNVNNVTCFNQSFYSQEPKI